MALETLRQVSGDEDKDKDEDEREHEHDAWLLILMAQSFNQAGTDGAAPVTLPHQMPNGSAINPEKKLV